MKLNAKGPAEAATSPDHGSHISPKETKMNDHLDITEAAAKPVSRRNFIAIAAAGSAALPAAALAGVSGKTSRLPQPELPIESFDRHASGVAEALDEYLDGRFYARIYPSKFEGCSFVLMSIAGERIALSVVEPRLMSLIDAHKHACAALNVASDVFSSRNITKAAERHWNRAYRAEAKATDALLAYVPQNDVSRRVKARYLLPFTAHAQLSDKQIAVLLTSMCGRCA